MKSKQSAGILLWAWTLPKGEFDNNEAALDAAIREFREETGVLLEGNFFALSPIKQKSGKIVHAWAIEGNFDPSKLVSNTFEIEWPPHSGKMLTFPEIDRAAWFKLEDARRLINPEQIALLEELQQILGE